MGLGVIAA